MSIATTPNYGLKKPDGSEKMNPAQFNYNADITDAELYKKRVITGASAPTTATVGVKGQFYLMDDGTKQVLYQCVAVAGSVYTWQNKAPCITAASAPSSNTVGTIGQFYLNTTTKNLYKCTAISGNVYTWDTVVPDPNFVKLMDITTSANALQVDLDVTGIDLTKYSMLHVFASLAVTPMGTATALYAKINNSGGYFAETMYNYSNYFRNFVAQFGCPSNDLGIARMDISGFTPVGSVVSGPLLIKSCGAGYSSGNYARDGFAFKQLSKLSDFASINFLTNSGSVYIAAGSRFEIYGVKR